MTAERFRGVFTDAGHLFALCGFAIAQPLFDLLGNNPTFFVAHDIEDFALVTFALGVLLVPPLVLFAGLLLARSVSPTAGRIVRAAMVGVLAALTVVPPIARTVGISTIPWIVGVVLVAIVAGIAYDRYKLLRTFATYLTPAPVLFLVLLLFISPARALVTGSGRAAIVDPSTNVPVVMVVFDELPLGALLDEGGGIDAERFPGFARLAGLSTWYPQAATVALYTHMAVPAVASGFLPTQQPVPVADNYPRSVFTMLASTHTPHVTESLTRLCPEDYCKHGQVAADADLVSDVETVYLHSVLSDELAEDWGVAAINDRWAGFGEDEPRAARIQAEPDAGLRFRDQVDILLNSDKVGEFAGFVDSMGRGEAPGLWFIHSLLPHGPHLLLPDGSRYDGARTPGRGQDLVWGGDQRVVDVSAQRLVLQTMAVDRLIDAMLDRLEETGLLDRAMVVVTADHGAVFLTRKHFRALTPPGVDDQNKHQILPVPLFVKYPDQQDGKVDDRAARNIDVVPTIADALDISLPDGWHFDGRSLLAPALRDRPYRVVEDAEHEPDTIAGPVDARLMASYFRTLLGPSGEPHDGYRMGPYGSLVGTDPGPLVRSAPIGTVVLDDPAAYADVQPRSGFIPAMVQARVTGAQRGDWVAVAVNGTIAGVGPVYQSLGEQKLVAMLDPELFRRGRNEITVFRIDENGAALQPLGSAPPG